MKNINDLHISRSLQKYYRLLNHLSRVKFEQKKNQRLVKTLVNQEILSTHSTTNPLQQVNKLLQWDKKTYVKKYNMGKSKKLLD